MVSCPTNTKNLEWYLLLMYFVLGSWFQHGCCKAYWEECKNLLTDVQYVSLHYIFCCLLEFSINVKTSAVSIFSETILNHLSKPSLLMNSAKKKKCLKSEVAIASLLSQIQRTKQLFITSKNNNKITGNLLRVSLGLSVTSCNLHKKGRILWF